MSNVLADITDALPRLAPDVLHQVHDLIFANIFQDTLSSFPWLLDRVLPYLDASDLVKISAAHHELRAQACQESVWLRLCEKDDIVPVLRALVGQSHRRLYWQHRFLKPAGMCAWSHQPKLGIPSSLVQPEPYPECMIIELYEIDKKRNLRFSERCHPPLFCTVLSLEHLVRNFPFGSHVMLTRKQTIPINAERDLHVRLVALTSGILLPVMDSGRTGHEPLHGYVHLSLFDDEPCEAEVITQYFDIIGDEGVAQTINISGFWLGYGAFDQDANDFPSLFDQYSTGVRGFREFFFGCGDCSTAYSTAFKRQMDEAVAMQIAD